MYVFHISDPSQGLGQVLRTLEQVGITSDSRNGPVIRFPRPVALRYLHPQRRLVDHPLREANHFFHLFETIWMFAGLDTVAPLDPFNSGMKQYSDNGTTFEAPYGHRWRVKWGDQIKLIVNKLIANPLDRRIVLQMWDPKELFKTQGLDFACNQQVLFSTRKLEFGYALDITVTNRSNDLIYGAMGSNLFHFSMLQEWIAQMAGMSVGEYTQMSVNMHLYLENPASKRCWEDIDAFYTWDSVEEDNSLMKMGCTLDMKVLRSFVNNLGKVGVLDTYLHRVVQPITNSYLTYKDKTLPLKKRIDDARVVLESCQSDPLRRACDEWFQRRYK